MWSKTWLHQELFEIFVCFAADSRLALMSEAFTARPLIGALSWNRRILNLHGEVHAVLLLDARRQEILADARIERCVPEMVEDGESPVQTAIEAGVGVDRGEDPGLASVVSPVFVDDFASGGGSRRSFRSRVYAGPGGRGGNTAGCRRHRRLRSRRAPRRSLRVQPCRRPQASGDGRSFGPNSYLVPFDYPSVSEHHSDCCPVYACHCFSVNSYYRRSQCVLRLVRLADSERFLAVNRQFWLVSRAKPGHGATP